METLSNVASAATSAASKAIWGEPKPVEANETQGNEPVAGLQGKGTATDPFDQGNSENPTEPTGKSNVNPTTTDSTSNPTTSSTETTSAPMNPNNVATGGEPKPLENTEGTGVTSSTQKYEPKGGDVVPSDSSNNPGAAPASGAAPAAKQQGADKPSDAPSGEEAGAVKETKDDAEAALKKRDPNDHSGEPMHMHNGNEVPSTQEDRRDSKAGNPGGQEHGKDPEATGKQWVKSSGLHAEGGDFDATKPGAGREADRILEQKGIHKDGAGKMEGGPPEPPKSSAHGEKEKVSLSEKLKTKLHIGHRDK